MMRCFVFLALLASHLLGAFADCPVSYTSPLGNLTCTNLLANATCSGPCSAGLLGPLLVECDGTIWRPVSGCQAPDLCFNVSCPLEIETCLPILDANNTLVPTCVSPLSQGLLIHNVSCAVVQAQTSNLLNAIATSVRLPNAAVIATDVTCVAQTVACTAGQYEVTSLDLTAVPPQPLRCAAYSNCTPGTFISTLPTLTSNRQCTPCPVNTFQSDANQLSCINVSAACAPGYINKFLPSSVSDRVCEQCSAGTVVAAGATPTTCITCTAGTYVPAGSVGTCSDFLCQPGTTDDDSNSSTPCVPCAPGSISAIGNAGACVPCTPGSVSNSFSTLCLTCDPGSYVPAKSPGPCSLYRCRAGTTDHDGLASSPCEQCNAGTAVPEGSVGPCTLFNCLAGSFSNASNSTCQPCQVGEYSLAAASACITCQPGTISDLPTRPCFNCSAGTYSNSSQQSACKACSVGQYSNPGWTACSDCLAGTFTNGSIPCATCPTGSYSFNRSSDCTFCLPGSFSPSPDTPCATCQPGQYSANASASQCLSCLPGTYADSSNSTACRACSAGFYSGAGATACHACSLGSVSNASSGNCSICPAGTSSNVNATACEVCGTGSYSSAGSANCSLCLPGSFANGTISSSCTLCSPGTFSGAYGTSACRECGVGAYTNKTGASSCATCQAGTFNNFSIATTCSPCPAGTFSNQSSSNCTPCDAGFISSAQAAYCQSCSPGFFTNGSATACVGCAPGRYLSFPDGSLANATCRKCSIGEYSTGNTTNCSLCEVGHFSAAGASSCVLCNGANQTFNLTSSQCTECAAGFAPPSNRTGACLRCSPGTFSLFGEQCVSCTAMDSSFYQGNSGASSCKSCNLNTSVVVGGGTACLCAPGFVNMSGNTTCSACDPLSEYQNEIGKTQCKPFSVCPDNAQPTFPGNATHDVVCPPAAPGRRRRSEFACVFNEIDASICDNWHVCAAGEGLAVAPTTTSDRVCALCPLNNTALLDPSTMPCEPCPAGTVNATEPLTGAPMCVFCPAGTHAPFPGSTTCLPCSEAHFSAEGQANCTLCPLGSFTNNSLECTACDAGFYNNNYSSTCFPCPAGSVSYSNQSSCTPCDPGFHAINATTCALCPAGTFRNSSESAVCQPCQTGYISSEGQSNCTMCLGGSFAENATVCSPCQSGSFSTNASTQCLDCPPNHYSGPSSPECLPCAPGTAEHEAFNVCSNCTIGFFSLGGTHGGCMSCSPGTFSATLGATACSNCSSGFVASSSNHSSCASCLAGTFSNANNTECLSCPVGSWSANESSFCVGFCTPGFKLDIANLNCSQCLPGTSSLANSYSCFPCPNGTFASNAASPQCTPCPPATISSLGAENCTACFDGFVPNTAKTECVACGTGQWAHAQVSTTCAGPCSAGQFLNITSLQCGNCTAGTYSNASSYSCASCAPGSFSAGSSGFCPSCLPGFVSDGTVPCSPCLAGSFQLNATHCGLCPLGQISADAATNCSACGPGTYASLNQTTCLPCVNGSWSGFGFAQCTKCQAGTFAPTLTTPCMNCSAGSYAPAQSMTCTMCAAGTTDFDGNSSTECEPCLPGTFTQPGHVGPCDLCNATSTDRDGNPATPCEQCPPGFVRPVNGVGPCLGCPAGTADLDLTSATNCTNCPLGSYSPANATACTACLPGFYDDDNNSATTCQPCPAKTFQPLSSQTFCQAVSACVVINVTYEVRRPTPTSDRLCGAVTLCSPKINFIAREPTFSSDRVCLSAFATYSIASMDLWVPRALRANYSDAYATSISNGTLQSRLQQVGSPLAGADLFVIAPLAKLSVFDNPPAGSVYVYANISVPSVTPINTLLEMQAAIATLYSLPYVRVGVLSKSQQGPPYVTLMRLRCDVNGAGGVLTQQLCVATLQALNPLGNLDVVAHQDCVPCEAGSSSQFRAKQCKLSLVGNCAACLPCPVGFYRKSACSGTQDTVCLAVPEISTPPLVGRVAVLQTEGSGSLLLTNVSVSTSPVMGLSFTSAGASLVTPTVLALSAGPHFAFEAETPRPPIGGLLGEIFNSVVYFDKPTVNVLVRLTDATGQLVFSTPTGISVAVSVSSNNSSSTSSCTPNNGGLCLAQVTIAASLFPLTGSRNVSVVANVSGLSPVIVGMVTLVAAPVASSSLWAVFPSGPLSSFSGNQLTVLLRSNTSSLIAGFELNITTTSSLNGLVQSLTVTCASNPWSFCVTLPGASPSQTSVVVYPRPGFEADTTINATTQARTLLRIGLTLNTQLPLPAGVSEVPVQVQFDLRRLSPPNALSSNTILCFGRPPPTANIGTFFYTNSRWVRLYPTLSLGQPLLVNTVPLTTHALNYSAKFYAVSTSGSVAVLQQLTSAAMSSCNVSNAAALGLLSNCSGLQLTNSHVVGADAVTASFYTLDGLVGTLTVAVFVPTLPVRVTAEVSTLRPIRGLANPAKQCGPIFSSTKIQALTVFSTGGTLTNFTAEVASIIPTPLTSSNTAVVTVDPFLNYATGVASGTAMVGFGALGSVALQVSVSDTVAISTSSMGLLFNANLVLAPSSNLGVRGNLTFTFDETFHDQAQEVPLLAAVTVFDGVTSQAYSFPAPLISTYYPTLFSMTPNAQILHYPEATVVTSNASFFGLVQGEFAHQTCPNAEINLLPSVLSVGGTIEQPLALLITLNTMTLVLPGAVTTAANLSSTIVVTDVLAEFQASVVSVLSHVVLTSETPSLLTYSNGVFVAAGTQTGTATIKATYTTGQGTVVHGVIAVQVVAVDVLSLHASLAIIPNGAPITTLYSLGVNVFQHARLTTSLLLSNGEAVDVSNLASPPAVNPSFTIANNILTPLVDFVDAVITTGLGGLTASITLSASFLTPPILQLSVNNVTAVAPAASVSISNDTSPILTLGGPEGSRFQLGVKLAFADGSSAVLTPDLLLGAGVTVSLNDSSIVFASSTLELILVSNSQVLTELTITAPGVQPVIVFVASNLALDPQRFDVDVGASLGPPIGALHVASSLTLPVRVNLPNPTGAFSVTLTVNPSVFSLTAVSVSSNAPVSAAVRPGAASVVFTVFSLAGLTGVYELGSVTLLVNGAGQSSLNATFSYIYSTSIPPQLFGSSVAAHASAMTLTVPGMARRSLELAPFDDEYVFVSRRCVRPPGDLNGDCLFNVADVLIVAQYCLWLDQPNLPGNTTFLASLAPASMDVTLEGQVTFADVNRLQDILIGRSAFVSRANVVSVASAISNCELALSVTLLATPVFTARIFFILSPNTPSDTSAFTTQSASLPSAPGLSNAVLLEATASGNTFAYRGPSNLVLEQVGISIVLAISTVNGPVYSVFVNVDTSLLPASSLSLATLGLSGPVAIPRAWAPLQTFNASQATAVCRQLRTPYGLNLTASVDPTVLVASFYPPPDTRVPLLSYILSYRRVAGQVNALPNTLAEEQWRNQTVNATTSLDGLVYSNITLLQPFIFYEAFVTPQPAPGYFLLPSTSSTGLTAEAAPSGPVLELNATATATGNLTATWADPLIYLRNGVLRSYEIRATRVDGPYTDPVAQTLFNATATQRSVTLTGLESFVNYSITVRAVTVATGPASAPFVALTSISAPEGAPTQIEIFPLAENLTTIWNEPLPYLENGPLNGFIIEYQRATSTNYGDGTIITDAALGGNSSVVFTFPVASFPGPSAALYTTNLPPPGQAALTPFYDYLVRVRATNAAGNGPQSLTFANRTSPALPGAPTALAGFVQNTTLLFNWTLPLPLQRRGVVFSYLFVLTRVPNQNASRESPLPCPSGFVRYTDDACQISIPRLVGSETVTISAIDLQPNIDFTGQVAAINPAGRGDFSVPFPLRTGITVPTGPVQSLTATAQSSSSVRVSWQPPLLPQRNGPIVTYFITVTRVAGQPEDPSFLSVPLNGFAITFSTPDILDNLIRQFNVNGLQKNTQYLIAIVPATVAGVAVGPPATTTVTTLEDIPAGPPLTLTASALPSTTTPKSVSLSWSPPTDFLRNGVIQSYRVTYFIADPRLTTPVGVATTFDVADVSVQIDNLLSFVNYNFTVAAATTVGLSSFLAQVSVVTTSSLPTGRPSIVSVSNPRSACVSSRCTGNVTLTWSDPDPVSMCGPIVSWTIRAYLTSSQQNALSVDASLPRPSSASPAVFVPLFAALSKTFNSGTKLNTYTFVVSDLQTFSDFIFEVALNNDVGQGPFRQTAESRTAQAAPTGVPNSVSITATYNSVTVFFQPPTTFLRHSIITGFGITLTRAPTDFLLTGGATATRNSPASSVTVMVTSSLALADNPTLSRVFNDAFILPYTNYSATVMAYGAGFAGPVSSSVAVTTGVQAPSRPPVPEVLSTASTTATIAWPILSTIWGPIRRIQVVVEPASSSLFSSCNLSTACTNGILDNYETNTDCGGDCGACTTLLSSGPVLPLVNYTVATSGTPRAYVTFQRDYAIGDNTSGLLVIGDGQMYDGQLNGPLTPSTLYNFRILAFTGFSTSLMSISNSSCSINITILPVTSAAPSAGGGGGGGLGLAAAGAGGAVAVAAIGVFIWIRRRKQQERENELTNDDRKIQRLEDASEATLFTPNGSTTTTLLPATKSESKPPRPAKPAKTTDGERRSTLDRTISIKKPSGQKALPLTSSADAAMLSLGVKLPPVKRNEVSLEALPGLINRLRMDSNIGYAEEFESLETGKEFPREAALHPMNKVKNRYANILPYDHSRVTLSIQGSDPCSDYINASFVDGFAVPRHYIAAQGPTDGTLCDFWRMIWETRTLFIIMLTNLEEKGRIKCSQYWPSQLRNEIRLANGLALVLTAEEIFPDYLVRTLSLQNGSETRVIRQFHYIAWPDHGVPDSSATTINILRKIRAARTPNSGPLLVHCSAGVGRTGTLIAIDYNMDRAAKNGTVDVLGCLNDMRRQRSTVVQTEDQYVFVYSVLADSCKPFVVDLDPIGLRRHFESLSKREGSGPSVIEAEFKTLNEASEAGAAPYRTDAALQACNREKNRSMQMVPYDHTRIKLNGIPGVVGSDYINASWVAGYEQARAFVCCQGPLDSTINAFWEMVWETDSCAIVMLSALTEDGRECSSQYWPDADESPMSFGSFDVALTEERDLHWCVERAFLVTETATRRTRNIRHWQYTSWPVKGVPESGRSLVDLVRRVRDHARRCAPIVESIYGNQQAITDNAVQPVVVHCSNGVARTGVFCSTAIGIRRLEIENRVDLYSIIKHMRTQRPNMVPSVEFYQLAYRCLLDHLEMPAVEAVVSLEPNPAPPPLVRRAPPPVPMAMDVDTDTPAAWMTPPTGSTPDIAESSFLSNSLEDSFGFDTAIPEPESFGFLDEAA